MGCALADVANARQQLVFGAECAVEGDLGLVGCGGVCGRIDDAAVECEQGLAAGENVLRCRQFLERPRGLWEFRGVRVETDAYQAAADVLSSGEPFGEGHGLAGMIARAPESMLAGYRENRIAQRFGY